MQKGQENDSQRERIIQIRLSVSSDKASEEQKIASIYRLEKELHQSRGTHNIVAVTATASGCCSCVDICEFRCYNRAALLLLPLLQYQRHTCDKIIEWFIGLPLQVTVRPMLR